MQLFAREHELTLETMDSKSLALLKKEAEVNVLGNKQNLEKLYKDLLDKRNVYKYIKEKELIKEGICFLCSEQMPTNCHRK